LLDLLEIQIGALVGVKLTLVSWTWGVWRSKLNSINWQPPILKEPFFKAANGLTLAGIGRKQLKLA
jgi:hypothetical protein